MLLIYLAMQVKLALSGTDLAFKPDSSLDQINGNSVRKAIVAWANSLSDNDYNATFWRITMRTQPQNFFVHYGDLLSHVFADNNAIINFVLVGACDGTNDQTIRDAYLPNLHWRGLFVEPVPKNYLELTKFLDSNKVADRSFALNTAVTDYCETANVTFKVSAVEDNDPDAPHWVRRQIGSIVQPGQALKTDRWKLEQVKCSTPAEIMSTWSTYLLNRLKSGAKRKRNQRVHVLKIDAEGHDYKVLKGFMDENVPASELPLIISYEAKSMDENLPVIREIMEKRGYVNSLGTTNDGFSLLKADAILASLPKGKMEKGKRKYTQTKKKQFDEESIPRSRANTDGLRGKGRRGKRNLGKQKDAMSER